MQAAMYKEGRILLEDMSILDGIWAKRYPTYKIEMQVLSRMGTKLASHFELSLNSTYTVNQQVQDLSQDY
jgi:hypothetical protein